MKLGPRYLWFKLALGTGSLLGLVLLAQSVYTYYQVSRSMVTAELRREAQRQVDLLARDALPLGSLDAAGLQPILDELRQDAPNRIAWVRVVDFDGETIAASGLPVSAPARVEMRNPAGAPGVLAPDIRQTDQGSVLVSLIPLRSGRRFFGDPGARPPERGDAAPGRGTAAADAGSQSLDRGRGAPRGEARQGERQAGGAPPDAGAAQRAGTDGREATRPAGAEAGRGAPAVFRARPRMVEIALYMASASATFAPLLTQLIVNSTAALGLVASMVLIWARFPNYLRGKQLEQQTELARKVQTDLLPAPNLTFENVDFSAECVPAWQVGGDFYDVFPTPDGRMAIALGDVSGKGLPASVVVGLLLGAIRSSDWLAGKRQHEEATRQISELLRTRTAIERFASLFWCTYEPATRMLRYINAGHLAPMVVTKSGYGPPEILRLEEGGPILGVLPNVSYRQGAVEISAIGVIVLYSDGVVEAENSEQEQFGEERLQRVVVENAHRPSAEIRDEILRQVRLFLGKERAQDDLTLVVARLRSKQAQA